MKHGILFQLALKRRVADGLIAKGKSHKDVKSLMTAVTPDLIDATCEALPNVAKAMANIDKASAIGDGSIIRSILEFLASEEGRALISAIIQILIGLI